jgi:hypothetical protein
MNFNELIEFAAKAKAFELIQLIETGEKTYEAAIAELRGKGR